MAEPFESADQFREVMGKAFQILLDDDGLSGPFKAAETTQSYFFENVPAVAHLRPTREGEAGSVIVKWGDADWEPRVRMTMTAAVANSFFQGKENITVAIASKRIKAGGDVKAVLGVLPLTQPLFEKYRAMVEADYPHLVAN